MVDVWQGQMAERKSWIPEISKTDLVVDKTPDGLLKQTRTTKLRRATFCGTPIVVHTLRTTALQSRLQDATLAALQDADTSWLHPVSPLVRRIMVSTETDQILLNPESRPSSRCYSQR